MNWKKGILLILGILALILVIKEGAVPWLLRRKLIALVHDSCDTCQLSLARVDVSFFPPGLALTHPQFVGGTPNATMVYAVADSVSVPLIKLPLFNQHWKIGLISAVHPVVRVVEGDLTSPPSKDEEDKPSNSDFELEGAEAKGGEFSYTRERKGPSGTIHIYKINAVIGALGTTEALKHRKVKGEANGILEKSGKFHLAVDSDIFQAVPKIEVKLAIANQNLADINLFFVPNDGIHLKGDLIEGESTVIARGRHLNSTVYAKFQNLEIDILKNQERGAVSAFFQNLIASIKLGRQNVDGRKYDRRATVSVERKPKQSIISFILSGMKEAAFKVAGNGR